jgi:uncharacterized membrane protein
MNRFAFWQKWLLIMGALIITFGLAMAFLNRTSLFYLFDQQINPTFWDTKEIPSGLNEFQGWIYGISGSTMAGWGVFLTFIAHVPS